MRSGSPLLLSKGFRSTILLFLAYLVLTPAAQAKDPTRGASDRVREYLATLQRLFSDKRTLTTPEEREKFCKEWGWLMTSMKMASLSEKQTDRKDLKEIVDCDRMLHTLDSIRQTPYSSPEFDWMRSYVEGRVGKGIAALGLQLKHPPIIGALPVGYLNAKVINVPDTNEPLIVINDEVFRLPYDSSRAVVRAIDFKVTDNHYVRAITNRDQIIRHVEQHPDILQGFEVTLLRYLHYGPANMRDSPIAIDTDLGFSIAQLYYNLSDAVEIFIFSHEFAHLLLGHNAERHLPLALNGTKAASTLNLDETIYSWKQELEADAYGFFIMDSVLKGEAIERSGALEKDFLYPFLLSGPSFFFLSMERVERAKTILETGEIPALKEEDIKLAEKAISQVFEVTPRPSTPTTKEPPDPHVSSHPPFRVRFIAAKLLEAKTRESFMKTSQLPPGLEQIYRFAELFQDTLVVLSERVDVRFKERYQRSKGQQTTSPEIQQEPSPAKNKVVRNELSPELLRQELKERGLDVLDQKARSLTDDFIRYDFLASKATSNLLSESPETLKAAEKLADELEKTGLRSKVSVTTRAGGARIHFRLIARQKDTVSSRLTNDTDDDIPIGLYYIWAERQGTPTSSKSDVFRIVKPKVAVEIEEN